jgi:hypothetical protein
MSHEGTIVCFESFEDLQSRLILMPRVEEEGLGAIATADDCSVQGFALIEIVGHADDLYERDFCEILSIVREADMPLNCRFVASISEQRHDEEKKEDTFDQQKLSQSVSVEASDDEKSQNDCGATDSDEDNCGNVSSTVDHGGDRGLHVVTLQRNATDDATIDSSSSTDSASEPHKMQLMTPTWSDLNKWTTRMKKTSAEFTAVAASSAVQLAKAAKERAILANTPDNTTKSTPAATTGDSGAASLGLYIHTSSGAWLPLPRNSTNTAGELLLTNASVLSVRISSMSACTGKAYTFQWYRSCNLQVESEWELLEGATGASFQPCATEVGHRLRCLIKTNPLNGSFDDQDPGDSETDQKKEVTSLCETELPVRASEQLFNGARQALTRDSSFGGLVGKGNAEGRSFSIKIQTVCIKDEHGVEQSIGAVTIYQVSGKVAEPMHPEDEPILGVIASADHTNPKEFHLRFRQGVPESASLVAALVTENRFCLQSSTRLGRESILLALGIANFRGKAGDLTPETLLFDSPQEYSISGSANDHQVASSIGPNAVASTSATSDQSRVESPTLMGTLLVPVGNPPVLATQEEGLQHPILSVNSELGSSLDGSSRADDLEKENALLRGKLERKNKVVAELQRQVALSDSAASKAEQLVKDAEKAIHERDSEKQSILQSLRQAEKKADTLEDLVRVTKHEHEQKVATLERKLNDQSEVVLRLEKKIRTLENEKAVLSAGIDVRESKLSRMDELQQSYSEMSNRIQSEEVLRVEIEDAKRRNNDVLSELESSRKALSKCNIQLDKSSERLTELQRELELEREKTLVCHSEVEQLQLRIQKLIAERNNYKQKGDSLSKEMSRVCRNGRSVRDVEKIIADEASRRQEVELLREQKRRALEDLEHYRTSYEQSRAAQQLAGLDSDTASVLERNVELERLLSELTEYVSAKEMQLETLMQVNEAIQSEMRELAKSTMNKNMSRNDV